MCKLIFFQIGKIGAPYITDSNSVELFNVFIFLAEKQTSKVKIPLFKGFVLPSDFQSQAGTLSSPDLLGQDKAALEVAQVQPRR